jgi:hypothetical protein
MTNKLILSLENKFYSPHITFDFALKDDYYNPFAENDLVWLAEYYRLRKLNLKGNQFDPPDLIPIKKAALRRMCHFMNSCFDFGYSFTQILNASFSVLPEGLHGDSLILYYDACRHYNRLPSIRIFDDIGFYDPLTLELKRDWASIYRKKLYTPSGYDSDYSALNAN